MIIISKQIRALIFDCDGTLVDSMPHHFASWQETFQAAGREYPHEFIDLRKGMPPIEVIKQYNNEFHADIDAESFVREKETRAGNKLRNVQPIIPVLEIVHKYKEKLPMAVCSGSGLRNVLIALSAIGLEKTFKIIISSDDKYKAKPAPDMFLEAAKRLHVEPKYCQVFEDSDFGVTAAEKAGMVITDIRNYI